MDIRMEVHKIVLASISFHNFSEKSFLSIDWSNSSVLLWRLPFKVLVTN